MLYLINGYPLSNSFHRLDERFDADTNEINEVAKNTLKRFDDQPFAHERVEKLFDDIDLLSKALVSQQAQLVFKNLETMVKTHQSRLLSYAALCAQREIVLDTCNSATKKGIADEIEAQCVCKDSRFKIQYDRRTRPVSRNPIFTKQQSKKIWTN